ncbi:hypothetical protein D3C73_1589560 [compost metagenome]
MAAYWKFWNKGEKQKNYEYNNRECRCGGKEHSQRPDYRGAADRRLCRAAQPDADERGSAANDEESGH